MGGNMEKIIIYGSKYGTTKGYAEKLSELTGISCSGCRDIKNMQGCKLAVYLGGLYAGGVMGLKSTLKLLPESAELILVTVGLADVSDEENVRRIRASLEKQMPEELYRKALLFHLRGGIDYGALSMKHRLMMAALHKSLKNMPEEKQTLENREMLETYGGKVNFVDFATLEPVIDAVKQYDNSKFKKFERS